MSSATSLSFIPVLSRLSPLVIRVLGCNPGTMTLQGTNTYLVGHGPQRILIDTGDGQKPEYNQALSKILREERAGIHSIILTHWHLDHVGGLANVLKQAGDSCRVFKFPRVGDSLEVTSRASPITDRQTFAVEGATLTAWHTPGHTVDHVVLHLQEENALFSGDCILGEGTGVFEDLYEYMNSLSRIAKQKPALIYPAHGAVIPDPVHKIQYYIQHRKEREEQILAVLADENQVGGFTPLDFVKRIYKTTPEKLHDAAAKNVSQHLSKLVKEGRVRKVTDSANGFELAQPH
ncbi:beta-lactamase-like protein 2 homolog [Tigriopus californicus]|uniref:beta-lactamase-like protein 2 homolog n=1 Tax=Tigriopus californicus TaxID=6832 RepID=UPI0027DA7929|nr:beta-lactamase-like protein 2 homolog [Tigriopus californicus]XP_059087647.1 beta-lactamase-like protein 2 homolog [Tigriopus californicus]